MVSVKKVKQGNIRNEDGKGDLIRGYEEGTYELS